MKTLLVLALLFVTSPASAGVYGRLGGGLGGPVSRPDCSKLTPTDDDFPDWSRLQWSLKVGGGWMLPPDRVATSSGFTVVPQLSWQFWGREGQCAGGGGMFGSRRWQRRSLAWSIDLVWRALRDEPTHERRSNQLEVRPGLRLARATFDQGFLSVGSSWLPSFELAVTAGPTFDPGVSGAAVSLGATAAILAVELRVAAHTQGRGQEVMLLVGLADLHGLWKLGPRRDYK